jgi:hypothetical protein
VPKSAKIFQIDACAHRNLIENNENREKQKQQAGKMADGADIDLYADDLDQDFAQVYINFASNFIEKILRHISHTIIGSFLHAKHTKMHQNSIGIRTRLRVVDIQKSPRRFCSSRSR